MCKSRRPSCLDELASADFYRSGVQTLSSLDLNKLLAIEDRGLGIEDRHLPSSIFYLRRNVLV